MNSFANKGFGWFCIKCSNAAPQKESVSRLLNEGEAESKRPEFSESAMAKWTGSDREGLICPRCGISEALCD